MDIEALQRRLARFAEERDWNRFHSPKNLAMALSAEAGELLEAESEDLRPETREAVAQEIADVMIYLLRLADRTGIDPATAIDEKMRLNAERYPVELARGNATKYNRRD